MGRQELHNHFLNHLSAAWRGHSGISFWQSSRTILAAHPFVHGDIGWRFLSWLDV
jgi:hypothetical protein